jgi:flagellar basal-body rod protein FlgC
MSDPMKGVFRGFDIAASGLRAELQRSEIIASNLGNMHRTGNAQKEPYRRKVLVFEELLEQARGRGDAGGPGGSGVTVARVVEDRTPFPVVTQPGHPDADEAGRLMLSNVDVFQELVDMSVVERSFDANLTAMRTYRSMLQNTITNMSR